MVPQGLGGGELMQQITGVRVYAHKYMHTSTNLTDNNLHLPGLLKQSPTAQVI